MRKRGGPTLDADGCKTVCGDVVLRRGAMVADVSFCKRCSNEGSNGKKGMLIGAMVGLANLMSGSSVSGSRPSEVSWDWNSGEAVNSDAAKNDKGKI